MVSERLTVSEVNGKYAPVPGKIPGRPINMSGVMLVFAPLTLDMVQEFEPKMATLGQGKTLRENIEDALPILLASLSRNYSDMTVEQLRGLVDVANFREATEAVVDISGYKRVAPGEIPPASQ